MGLLNENASYSLQHVMFSVLCNKRVQAERFYWQVVSDHIPQMMNGPAPSDDIGMSTPVPLEQMQKIKGIVNDTCGSDNKDAPKKVSIFWYLVHYALHSFQSWAYTVSTGRNNKNPVSETSAF